MKNKIISALTIACLTLLYSNVIAQDNKEAKTLFGSENPVSLKDVGFFIAPIYGLSQMDGSTTSLFNLRGGVNFRDQFSFGAYFNTSINQIRPQSETVPNIYMDYWTVGGFAEYTLFPKKIVHITFPLYVGYSEVQMDSELDDPELGESNFFQLEPAAMLEVNLHKFVRFNIGAGYRFVGPMNYRNLNQADISGLTAYAGLRFGLFR